MQKILFFNSNHFPASIEQMLEKILNNLSSGGDIFYYTVAKISKETKKIANFNSCKYFLGKKIFNNSLIFFVLFPLLQLLFLFKILKWRIKGVKKIICFGWREKVLSFFPCKILKIKTYWVEWDLLNFSKKRFWRLIYRLLAKKIIIVVGVEKIKEELMANKIKEENIYLIHPGIEIDKIINTQTSNQFTNKDIFRVGTICKLGSNKGIEQLLQAVKTAHNFIPNLRLTVVGDGEDRKSLVWLAKKLEISEITQFSGYQSDVNSWISSFSIFLYPTLKPKTFSLTILQAMAYAKPVVVFDTGALNEQVENNKTGIVVKKGDSQEMAQAIIYLNRNPEVLEKFGLEGKAIAQEKFDFNKNTNIWKQLILN